jgi:hypothetical protein
MGYHVPQSHAMIRGRAQAVLQECNALDSDAQAFRLSAPIPAPMPVRAGSDMV